MNVELGNSAPRDAVHGTALPGPAVTIMQDVPNQVVHDTEARVHHEHFAQNPGAVTHLPGHEGILRVIRAWQEGHSFAGAPSFVWVYPQYPEETQAEAEEMQRQLGNFWGCWQGRPDDTEEKYWTVHGSTLYPPGLKP